MKTKLKVIPFIETNLQNKKYFNQKFVPEMLGNIKGRRPMNVRGFAESNENYQKRLDEWLSYNKDVLFENWTCKKRTNWIDFSDNINKIEIYPKTYKINGIELPLPETIDNFITDCRKLNVDLLWRNDLVNFDINIYHIVSGVVAEEYTIELLTIMDKL